MYASYLRTIALLLLLFACGYGVCTLILFRSGEYLSLEDIVETQRSSSGICLYGSVLHNDYAFYKLEGQRAAKPSIVSIGTSRVLGFREQFFTKPFYNMGMSVTSIRNGQELTDRMIASGRPDILLLGIEPWWFNRGFRTTGRGETVMDGSRFHFRDAIRLARLFVLRRIPIPKLHHRALASPTSCMIGVQATEQQAGFGVDGSYYYTNLVTGTTRNVDERFARTQQWVQSGTDFFVYGSSIHLAHWKEFVSWLRGMQQQGITVIGFIPPFAATVNREMERQPDRYAYIASLLRLAEKEGIPLVDLRDAEAFGSSDCEFLDGYHGGSVTTARLLLALKDRYPALESVVDTAAVMSFIRENTGYAMEKNSPLLAGKKEGDFLKIGCRK